MKFGRVLPVVRTSVDHGTAYEIAGRGVADHRSFIAELDAAESIAHHRQQEKPS